MRSRWQTAIGLVAVSADNAHGVLKTLLEHEDESRDYPVLVDPPDADAAERALPRRWDAARGSIRQAVDAVDQLRTDFKSWMDGADLDDSLRATLADDDARMVRSLCNAVAQARRYYTAAGGYANDLTFLLISDSGDRSCQNVAMQHPYSTTVVRRALVTIAESTNEQPDGNNEDAFLSDHTGFIVPAGTSVQVIGHRYIDSTESTMCQIHGGGGTGWVPCSWLARAPRVADG